MEATAGPFAERKRILDICARNQLPRLSKAAAGFANDTFGPEHLPAGDEV